MLCLSTAIHNIKQLKITHNFFFREFKFLSENAHFVLF